MGKVVLIIIYNHQYNSNIEILEQIYKNRFSNIYHLVPFYDDKKSNVIPVYDSSYYFQGYVAQGLKSYFREDYSHYFFIADDLILNPIINEKNYVEHLRLNQKTCFLSGFINLHERNEWWPRVGDAFRYNINFPGVEAENQLPNYDFALKKFNKFGLEIKPLRFDQIWKTPKSIRDVGRMIVKDRYYVFRLIYSVLFKRQFNLSYPLVGGYSDIFVISSNAIKQFCHYCGVFATTKLFVELGIPTSIILSAEEIVTETDLKLQGKALWKNKDFITLEKYESNLNKLLEDFPENYLYLHPIKPSKWA